MIVIFHKSGGEKIRNWSGSAYSTSWSFGSAFRGIVPVFQAFWRGSAGSHLGRRGYDLHGAGYVQKSTEVWGEGNLEQLLPFGSSQLVLLEDLKHQKPSQWFYLLDVNFQSFGTCQPPSKHKTLNHLGKPERLHRLLADDSCGLHSWRSWLCFGFDSVTSRHGWLDGWLDGWMICFTIYGPGSIWHGCWDFFCFFLMVAQVLCIWILLGCVFLMPAYLEVGEQTVSFEGQGQEAFTTMIWLDGFRKLILRIICLLKWRQHDKICSVSFELGLKQLPLTSFALSLSIYHKCSYVRIHISHMYIYIHSNYIDAYIHICTQSVCLETMRDAFLEGKCWGRVILTCL